MQIIIHTHKPKIQSIGKNPDSTDSCFTRPTPRLKSNSFRRFAIGFCLIITTAVTFGCSKKSGDDDQANSDGNGAGGDLTVPYTYPETVDKLPDPDDLQDIGKFYTRFDKKEKYDELTGETFSIKGSVISAATDEQGLYFVVNRGKMGQEGFGEVKCYVNPDTVFQKCLPGHEILIRGTVKNTGFSFQPILKDCKVIAAMGTPAKRYSPAHTDDSGFRNSVNALMTGKVRAISQSESKKHYYVDLEEEESGSVARVHFSKPFPSKIEVGNQLTVFGTGFSMSLDRGGSRSHADLYHCVVIDCR